jgi:hypothetical protein
MGSNLTFVSGSTRIDLNDRIVFFLQSGYYPTIDVKAKTVTESVKVQLRGSISANIQHLNQWFELARSDDPAQEKVYLEYKVADSETAWRSRVYDGAVTLGKSVSTEYKRGRVNVEIAFERDPFWEGPETALPIGNLNSSSPARVYNANDGTGTEPNKRINSAYVTANLILGDLPTPVKLTIDNLYTSNLGHLWIGMNKTRPNWNSGWMLEAESAIGITPVTTTDASGGAFAQGQLTYGTSSPILRWPVTDALVSAMRGQRLRMLLRAYFTGSYSSFKYKLRIVSGVTLIWESDWVRESEAYSRSWLDLFEFRMPPWLEGKDNLSGLILELWATPIKAGTWTWAFDDVMLFAEDGFVNLDTSVVPGGKLIIDGDTGWSEDTTGKKSGLKKMIGSLMLTPKAFHLFYFAMHRTIMDSAPTDFLLGISGSYRPRRWLI